MIKIITFPRHRVQKQNNKFFWQTTDFRHSIIVLDIILKTIIILLKLFIFF
jgi:hypothetical protein